MSSTLVGLLSTSPSAPRQGWAGSPSPCTLPLHPHLILALHLQKLSSSAFSEIRRSPSPPRLHGGSGGGEREEEGRGGWDRLGPLGQGWALPGGPAQGQTGAPPGSGTEAPQPHRAERGAGGGVGLRYGKAPARSQRGGGGVQQAVKPAPWGTSLRPGTVAGALLLSWTGVRRGSGLRPGLVRSHSGASLARGPAAARRPRSTQPGAAVGGGV